MKQFATFSLGSTYFGVNILQVKEINNMLRYTPVPDAPPFIKGLLNLRGQVITMFDLATRLGRDSTQIGRYTRTLVLKTDSETQALRQQELLHNLVGDDGVSFLVDKVGDVVEVSEEDIEPTPANVDNTAKNFISGVVELPEKLMLILNITEFIGNR